jgi:hypothetical protein
MIFLSVDSNCLEQSLKITQIKDKLDITDNDLIKLRRSYFSVWFFFLNQLFLPCTHIPTDDKNHFVKQK